MPNEEELSGESIGGRKMRIRVDEDLCIGDGSCVETCPEMFEMRDNSAVAKTEEVPEHLHDCCSEAADNCPVEAIIVEE
jgi:ferredoxin